MFRIFKKILVFAVLSSLILGISTIFLRRYSNKLSSRTPLEISFASECDKHEIAYQPVYNFDNGISVSIVGKPKMVVTYEDKIVDSHWFLGGGYDAYKNFVSSKYCVYRFVEPLTLEYHYGAMLLLRESYTITSLKIDDLQGLIRNSYIDLNDDNIDSSPTHDWDLEFKAKFKLDAYPFVVTENTVYSAQHNVHPGYDYNLVGGTFVKFPL